MGQILQAECPRCGYRTRFFAGGGMRDCELQTLVAALPPERGQALTAAAEQGAGDIAITRVPSRCAACGTLFTQAKVEYTLRERRETLLSPCPACGGDEAAELSEPSAPDCCPNCGGTILLAPAGHWD